MYKNMQDHSITYVDVNNIQEDDDTSTQPETKKPKLETQVPPKVEALDKEIEDIAKTIREANEKKMVQLKNVPIFNTIQNVEMANIAENISPDWTSVQGQFGWTELGNTIIPYITRSGEKFVSLRMANSKIFIKYQQIFSDEICSCFRSEKLPVTKAEAQLLNEINFRHCDNFFGSLEFSVNDYIITLKTLTEMYEFLDFCYVKLIEKNPLPHKRCGFIRIACQNCVPYVWYENVQYVPLFYFEGDCKYLDERATELRSWELAYLKVSCKIQGIRKELFDEESIRVVTLELLKRFFPPNTLFEDIWPTEFNTESLIQKPVPRLVSIEPNDQSQKIISNDCHPNKTIAQKRAMQMKTTLQKLPATMLTAQSAGAKNSVATIRNGLKPPPPPYPYSNSRSAVAPVAHKQNTYLNQYKHSMGITSTPNLNIINNTFTNSMVSNFRPNYQQSNPSPYPNRQYYSTLPKSVVPAGPNEWQIQDVDCGTNGCPYFLVRTQVEDKFFQFCLNMEPYITTTLLVSLEELSMAFFNISVDRVKSAINVMRLSIFLPNTLQKRTLERAQRYPTKGFIQMKDFIDNLPQLRYILTHQ